MRQASERSGRIAQAIRDALPDWSLASSVEALQALRGIGLITAVGFLAETGDLSRFEHPRRLMAWLGLVPSESSTGDHVRRGAITKAGNTRARRFLIESAWSYRFPARVSKEKQVQVERPRGPPARSPGKRRHGSVAGSAPLPGRASAPPWLQPQSPANSPHLSGR